MLSGFKNYSWVFLFSFLFVLFLRPFEGSGDFYHHINTGRLILESHFLPKVDIFSHTALGQTWVAHSWLAGVVFYLVFQAFGGLGVSILVALLAVLTFGLLFLTLKSYQVSEKANILTILMVAFPMAIRWPQRPEVFQYPLILALILLERLRSRHPWLVYCLPIIIWLWACFYGAGVILGIGILSLLILKQFINDDFKVLKNQRVFYLLGLISVAVSFLNGYDIKSLFYGIFYIPKISQYESEWAGIFKILAQYPEKYLIYYQYYILIYLIFVAIFGILVIFLLRKRLGQYKFLILLSLPLLIPFFSFRHVSIVVVLSSLLLGVAIESIKSKLVTVNLIISICLMAGLLFWVNPPVLIKPNDPAPGQMVDFIKQHQLYGKAFNSPNLGGFISYYLFPSVLIYSDTRDEVYLNTEVFEDLSLIGSNKQPMLPVLDKYHINLVIASQTNDLTSYLKLIPSPEWVVVFYQNGYFVAVPAQIAAEKGLPVIKN